MARSPRKLKDPWPRERAGLGAWWLDHGRVARETMTFVSSRLGTSFLVWLLVGIALALPAGLYLLQVNLAEMTRDWEGRPGLTVYFDRGASAEQLAEFAQRLRARPEVESVDVTDQEQALADFKAFGGLGDALDLLGENPLPASARAVLAPGAGVADLASVARLAQQIDGVAEVVQEATWLRRVLDLSALVTRLGLVLAVLFAIGAVLVTATSVRLAIEARLEEVRVLRLVGATAGQIRRPFLYFGAIYGLGGAVIAAMLLSFALLVTEQPLVDLLSSYGEGLELAGFDPMFLLGLLAVGLVLGILGSLVAARQRLVGLDIA